MFRIRVCSSCGIRVRIVFGTKCSDCEARQRAREREEENARLRRRVHFDDDPVIIHRSPSPCRLRIRRSSPRNNHDDNDRSVVRAAAICTTNDDDDVPSIADGDDDDDDWSRKHGTSSTVTRYRTNVRPGCWDRDRDVERARIREAHDRGVSENGTHWFSRRYDYERERHDRFGGHEYDREVNWEIRRDRRSRRRDRDIFDLFCEF